MMPLMSSLFLEKQPGAGQCLLMRLDGAHTAAVLVHAYAAVAHTVQQTQHTVPGFLYEVRGEEAAEVTISPNVSFILI